MSGRKRKVLTLHDKVAVINAIESGKKKADVCREFGLVNSTVGTIIKNKEKILKSFDQGGGQAKKIRFCEKPDVDSALIKWFSQCRSASLPINGPLLMEKAEEFGRLLGDSEFKCSRGWLDRFKRRHAISFGKISGQAKSVNPQETENWLTNVRPRLREGYKEEDIFNADETESFYKLLPDGTLKYENEKCIGGKLTKERLTVQNVGAKECQLATIKVEGVADIDHDLTKNVGTKDCHLDTLKVEEVSDINHDLITSDADTIKLVKIENDELEDFNDKEETCDLEIAEPTNQEVLDAVRVINTFFRFRETSAQVMENFHRLESEIDRLIWSEKCTPIKSTDCIKT